MKNNKNKLENPSLPNNKGSPRTSTKVGNISGGKGFAIGPGAKAVVVEIESLINISSLKSIFIQHWTKILITVVFQSCVLMLWISYKNRFLIPNWILIVIMFFLEVSIISSFKMRNSNLRLQYAILFITSLIITLSISASEFIRIKHPSQFHPDTFGVAIAQFGEGPDFRISNRSREVSQVVLQELTRQAKNNPELNFVQIKPIGLIKNQEEAWIDGSRVGADLVIWGQLQEKEDLSIISFSILETPDKVSNPIFARVLPIYEVAATSFFKVGSRDSDELAKGTTTISTFTFGLAHFYKWDFLAATEAFQESLTATTNEQEDDYHYLIYLYNGLSLQRLWKLEEANQYFDKAIEIHPDDPAPWLARAYGNRSLGKLDKARQDALETWNLCNKHIQINSESYVAYFDRAQANEILNDYEAALADYQKVKELAPELYIAYIGVNRALILLGRLPEALQNTQEAIKLAESNNANPAWAYVFLAHIQELMGETQNARFSFETAIDLAPDVDYMHLRYAKFLEQSKNPSDLIDAENVYQTYINVSENKGIAHVDFARFLDNQGRFTDAKNEYRKAIQYNPETVRFWVEYAEFLTRTNQYDEARQAYEKAVILDPGHPYTYSSYGNFLYYQGEFEAAIRVWEIAYILNSENCILLLSLGQAYELLGDLQQSISKYQIAVNQNYRSFPDCQIEAARRLSNFGE